MRTYRVENVAYDFQLDLPNGWGITSGFARIPVIFSNFFQRANVLEEFTDGGKQRLNIVIELLQPEIPPDINELVFTLNALKMNYTDVQFARITVGRRDHTCVTYVMHQKGWLKKYLIVLNGYGMQ